MYIKIGENNLFFDIEGSQLRFDKGRLFNVPTVLVIPGGPGYDHIYLREYCKQFDSFAQVLFVDLIGTGRSSRGNEQLWNVKEWASNIAELCQTISISPILLTFSFGGLVGLELASTFPNLPIKLILCGSQGRVDIDHIIESCKQIGDDVGHVAEFTWRNPNSDNWGEYQRICMPHYSTKNKFPQMGLKNFSQRVFSNFVINDLETSYVQRDSKAARVRIPVDFICGENDIVVKRDDILSCAKTLNDTASVSVRVKWIKNCGHWMYLDQPILLAEEIKKSILITIE